MGLPTRFAQWTLSIGILGCIFAWQGAYLCLYLYLYLYHRLGSVHWHPGNPHVASAPFEEDSA